ncbi:MAG: flagellar hook-length control protein FliK [Thermodesulfobacteriota bacterium]|nr:flagellar hook-length control protein FliK [Thermodesulfobacteriota bacterium]
MIKGIDILSSDVKLRPEANEKSVLSFLKKNDIVEARVLKLIPPSKAELLIAGKKVVADTSVFLKQGDTIQLKFTPEKNLQILKLVSPSNRDVPSAAALLGALTKAGPFSHLQNLFGGLTDVTKTSIQENLQSIPFFSEMKADPSLMGERAGQTGKMLQQLGEKLLELALKSEHADKGFLPRVLNQSGLLHERNLSRLLFNPPSVLGKESLAAGKDVPVSGKELPEKFSNLDLKAFVLKSLAGDTGKDPVLIRSLKGFAETIEKFQVLNHHTSDTNRYLIPFPVFADDLLGSGQLFLDLGKAARERDKKESRLIKLSILLNMSFLGAVRVDGSVLNKEISGVFKVSSEDMVKFVKSHISNLKKALLKQGFTLTSMECRMAASVELEENALFNMVLKEDQDRADQGVDIII